MEESFDPIAQTRANYYTPGSPVQFVRVELLKGSVSGDRAVCLTFKNVSQANLTALDIFFRCKGAGGSILCEADFAYRDLDVKPGELFGMDDAVFVTDKAINSVDVSLKRVCKGRQAISLEKIKRVRLPAPRPLSAEMEAALEERMSRKGLKFAPQVLDCGWYCACGAFHPKEEDTVYCSECGCDRILLQNAMNTLMQPEAAEPQAAPAEQTRVVGGFAGTPAPETKPSQEGTRAFPVPGKTVPAPKEEPTRVVNPSARPAGWDPRVRSAPGKAGSPAFFRRGFGQHPGGGRRFPCRGRCVGPAELALPQRTGTETPQNPDCRPLRGGRGRR